MKRGLPGRLNGPIVQTAWHSRDIADPGTTAESVEEEERQLMEEVRPLQRGYGAGGYYEYAS
jgi:hypothetical protein